MCPACRRQPVHICVPYAGRGPSVKSSDHAPPHAVQARFLLAKLNPSTTHASEDTFAASGELIYTDDVSLQACMPNASLTERVLNFTVRADEVAVCHSTGVFAACGDMQLLCHSPKLSICGACRCRCSWATYRSWPSAHEAAAAVWI